MYVCLCLCVHLYVCELMLMHAHVCACGCSCVWQSEVDIRCLSPLLLDLFIKAVLTEPRTHQFCIVWLTRKSLSLPSHSHIVFKSGIYIFRTLQEVAIWILSQLFSSSWYQNNCYLLNVSHIWASYKMLPVLCVLELKSLAQREKFIK